VGLSSGAGLAVAALTRLREASGRMPTGVVLLSPLLDATCSSVTWSSNEGVDWGNPGAIVHWAKLYAGDVDSAEPGISPINADLSGLPPILVVSGAAELLPVPSSG
jgi:acetyl esterase/lipase